MHRRVSLLAESGKSIFPLLDSSFIYVIFSDFFFHEVLLIGLDSNVDWI